MTSAVILAGGKGTRLGRVDVPKPMVPLGGKPLLHRQLELLQRYGVDRVYVLVSHRKNEIVEYFEGVTELSVEVEFIVESVPMGTAGAVGGLRDKLTGRFLVLYGDLVVDMSIAHLLKFDASRNAAATLVVHPNDHPFDSDLVSVDREGRVTAFHTKPHSGQEPLRNLVNAAIYVMGPRVFDYIPSDQPSDFGRDVLPTMVAAGEFVSCYLTGEYVRDMGTPERYLSCERDWRSGAVEARNREHPRRAVFLDRDGVINRERDGVFRPADFELLPGAADAIRILRAEGFLVIVVTNQPGIAKGFCDFDDVELVHAQMDTDLGDHGTFVDATYYCPHHPEAGHDGEVVELKVACDCRKPAPGMIHQADRDFSIDLPRSFLIGDHQRDIQAALAAGVRPILVGHADASSEDLTPVLQAPDLRAAVELILTSAGG